MRQLAQNPVVLRIAGACGAAIIAALCLRYLFIDNDAVRTACDNAPGQWWCGLRTRLSMILRHPALGWVILALAVPGLIRPRIWLVAIGLVLAALGLVLYQADLASGAASILLIGAALDQRAGEKPGRTA